MEKDKVEFTTKELELKRENHYVWADYLKKLVFKSKLRMAHNEK